MAEVDGDPERKGPTIATSANQCLQSFQKCLISASSINPRELSMIEDQVARFSSWAASIGVFAPGSASMDHRLRYAPEVHSVVTGLLESLNYQCQECLSILTTLVKSLEAGERYVPSENFPKSLNEIAAEISRLNKISNTIRRASKDTQALTASKFHVKDDEGNNVEETLLDNFKRHINDRFPNLGETLQERLARTMLLRRKQILYRRFRHGNVYTKTQDTIPAVSIKFPSAKPVGSLAESRPKQPKTSSTVSKPATATPSQIKSATTLAPEKFRIAASTPSVISVSKTIAFDSHESLAFPPAPGHAVKKRYEQLKNQRLAEYEQSLNSKKGAASNKPTVQELLVNDLQSLGEITCPYCLCALPAEEAFDETKWQNHIKNDLDPYVCLFEDCDQQEALYNHSDQWLSHLQQHRRFWRCPSHHDSEPFPSANDYIAHMREVHTSKLSDKQLRAMANKNSRKMKQLFSSCPLCGKEESDINSRLEDHLAGHLRSLALKSLPSYHENAPEDNEDGNNSIDVSRPKSRSTVKDLREDEDYVPSHLFTSEDFWDQWRPPLIQAPWWNFLDQAYEDLDLTVDNDSLFFDTYSFRDLPSTFHNDSIIQHIMQNQENQRKVGQTEHTKDRNVEEAERTSSLIETFLRQPPDTIDISGSARAKATKEMPSPTLSLSSLNSNAQETSGAETIPIMTRASSFHASPHSVVVESSEPYQIKLSEERTAMPSIPESSGVRGRRVTYEADDEGSKRIQDRNRRGGRSTDERQSGVYINGKRVLNLNRHDRSRRLPTIDHDNIFSAHSPPVPGPPNNTPSLYHNVGITASRERIILAEEPPSSNRRQRPIIIDERPRYRVEGIDDPDMDDTRTTKSAPARTSGYKKEKQQRRREREALEAEERLRQRFGKANATISTRPAAPAPPNPDKSSKTIYQRYYSEASDEEESRNSTAHRIGMLEETKELEAQRERLMERIAEANTMIASRPAAPAPSNLGTSTHEFYGSNSSRDSVEELLRSNLDERRRIARQEEENETVAQRQRLRERFMYGRRSTISGGSRRPLTYDEGVYRYDDNKPDDDVESSKQKKKDG
ncbi:hypothetical protein EDB82DRAFT_510398 [Fusarium venenatum]|uniref:uncharacterized protein n=1 Tax=Fusarium venenatum TaxID=56646 RepID=UPI001DB8C20D|nr:hypothetical protein EDB82DRAFT_510398 [Fusarium venenatum]